MMAYPGQTLTRTMLGQLCTGLWDYQSWLVVIQPGITPGSVVTPIALGCSAIDQTLLLDQMPIGQCYRYVTDTVNTHQQ